MQLLETAAELFALRGYRGTTTARLADAAGVTEPVLYQHFTNKLDLFVQLITAVGEEVLAAWRENLEGEDDPHARLETLLRGNPATHARGRGIYRVIFQAMTETDTDPRIRRAIRKHINALQVFLSDELESLQDSGVVRDDIDAAMLASFLVTVGTGFGLLAPLNVGDIAGPQGRKHLQHLLAESLSP